MPSPSAPKARFILQHWPWIALGASAFMLAAAHYAERVVGLPPCILCLKQREPYWVAIAVSSIAIGAGFTPFRDQARWLLNAVLCFVFLYGMGLAVYHAGAEYGFWEGPKACAAGGVSTVGDIEAFLKGEQTKVVSCEDPTYWPLPFVTMAGLNVLISAVLASLSAAAALKGKRS